MWKLLIHQISFRCCPPAQQSLLAGFGSPAATHRLLKVKTIFKMAAEV
jgi:hypothetical protein